MDWEIAEKLTGSIGVAGPVTGVHNGMLLVGGGANFPEGMPWEGGRKQYHNQIFLFTRSGRRINTLDSKFKLPENIAYPAVCTSPLGIVYAGGENENGLSEKAYLIQWDSTSSAVCFETLPDLPVALTNAAATAVGNIIYFVGGETNNMVNNKGWFLDLQHLSAGWEAIAPLPIAVSHMVFVSMGNKLYLLGGRRKNSGGVSELYNAVFAYDIVSNHWSSLSPLPYKLCAGTGVAFGDKGVVLFGGDKGTTFSMVEQYLVEISRTSDEMKKAELIQQKNKVQSTHPGFSTEVLFYNVHSEKTAILGNIPFPVPVTTTAFWWGDRVFIPSGEIKAGVRSPIILSVKM